MTITLGVNGRRFLFRAYRVPEWCAGPRWPFSKMRRTPVAMWRSRAQQDKRGVIIRLLTLSMKIAEIRR